MSLFHSALKINYNAGYTCQYLKSSVFLNLNVFESPADETTMRLTMQLKKHLEAEELENSPTHETEEKINE